MHAAKHFDPQIGIDIHLYVFPPLPTPIPLPTPHIGIVLDPFDYIPVIGGTVHVQGVKRATAGTGGLDVHIPLGPWMPTMKMPAGPQWDDEIFMGSMTVVADGDPLSRIAMPVLDCNVVGMINPFRLRKPKKPQLSMSLPTAVNLAIPNTVFVGGPPMISIMGMAFKGLFAGLGRLARTKFAKRIFEGAQGKWKKLFANMEPGFLKCKVLRAEPVDIRTGAVSVTHEDFSIPGRLPLTWTRRYRSDAIEQEGVLGPGWVTPADIRLEWGAEGVLFVPLQGPPAVFERLPLSGEALIDPIDGARLSRLGGADGDELHLRTKDGTVHVFAAPPGNVQPVHGEMPLPIQRLQDRCGNEWRFERQGDHLLRVVENGIGGSPGRFIEVASQAGRIHSMSLHDPITGRTWPLVRYRHDAQGDLVAAVDALDAARTFEYRDHRMVRHTDRVGLSFHYQYDERSRVVHSWGDGGLYDYRFAYHDELHETEVTDSLGHTSLVKFSDEGLPLCEIDPLGGCTFFEYDEWARTTQVSDPNGLKTGFSHDERGNLKELVRPDDSSTTIEYDLDDNATAITDPSGGRWQQQWDERGRLTAQVTPLGSRSCYAHDARGQLVQQTNPRGAVTRFSFDAHGQPCSMTNALGHTTRFEHDARGHLGARTDAAGRKSSCVHDAKGRLTEVRFPQGASVHVSYDAEDRPVRWIDERGHVTTIDYFGIGHVAKRHQTDGQPVRYLYDKEEQLVGMVNQRGETCRIARDALGRIVEEADYWGQTRRYAYDAGGRLLRSVDPLGREIRYTCDAVGRIVGKALRDAMDPSRVCTESFRYGGSGQLLEMRNEVAHVRRRFDADGRLLEETCNGFVVTNGYDEVGNRIVRRSSAGHAVAVEYDLLDQPVRLEIDGESPIQIERNALGQALSERFGAHLERTLSYDAGGLVESQAVRKGGVPLFDTRWAYDAAGHPTRRSDSALGVDEYSYDPAGRLLSHTDPDGRLRRMLADPGADHTRTRVRETGLQQAVGGAPLSSVWAREIDLDGHRLVFDRAGNLVSRVETGQQGQPALHLTWDSNHRLATSRWERGDRDGQVTTYGYDPLGRRVFKRNHATTTWFFWDGDALLGEAEQDLRSAAASASRKVIDIATARRQPPAPPIPFETVREYVYRPGSFEPLAVILPTGLQPAAPGASSAPASPKQPGDATGQVVQGSLAAAAPAADHRPGLGALRLGMGARLGEALAAGAEGEVRPPSATSRAEMPTSDARVLAFHNDIHGCPMRLTDFAGNVTWSARFDGHGALDKTVVSRITQPLRLQGQYHDVETGLHFNRYRYYEPRIGAYAGQDPIRYGGGIDLYGYAPNVFAGIDPLGLATRPIDRAVDYERQVRDSYGSQPFSARQYQSIVDGQVVNGVADNVAVLDGRAVAIEAKYVDDWSASIRNPASAIGGRGFAQAEQLKVIQQAKAYSGAFDEVIYHSNSADFIAHYSKKFDEAGIDNVRFIHTPCA